MPLVSPTDKHIQVAEASSSATLVATNPLFSIVKPVPKPEVPVRNQSTDAQKSVVETLNCPLKLPPASKLTRSQHLFTIRTLMDPRMLAIKENMEFYMFMDMRAEFKWYSLSMTSQKWVSATRLYNERLADAGKDQGVEVVKKNPRALEEKLAAVESAILQRIEKHQFACE